MKAILRNYRQSPRKVSLAAGLVRGKKVKDALTQLNFTVKRASSPVAKLIESAVSNAKNAGVVDTDSLIVKEIRVDKGIVLKRMMPRARGSASRINKRSSHVMVVLAEPTESKKKAKAKKATK
ncbi:MAG: 50S ribosomal protein L22 [Candidatus Taylorbacteria bacterium]|nr:50S ribosomal protein L22 [Candidatus Taylorbacteria bacterium]